MLVCYESDFFFSSRRRHTRWPRDWSSDVCSSDLSMAAGELLHSADHLLRNRRIQAVRRSGERRCAAPDTRTYRSGPLPVHHRTETRRSEERRVGKESRARMRQEEWQKKRTATTKK